MFPQLVMLGVGLLVTVTVIAIGSYVGTLRALDVFYGGGDSLFLSDDVEDRPGR
jgi:hypothetical protein